MNQSMTTIRAPDQGRSVRPPHKSVKNHIDQSNDLFATRVGQNHRYRRPRC